MFCNLSSVIKHTHPRKFPGALLRTLPVLACFVGLAACGGSDPLLVADYKSRLARSLETDIPATVVRVEIPQVLTFPRPRDLTQASGGVVRNADAAVGLLDFLSLGDCELQAVVAQKNSSLGRVALPSRLLVSELRFLQVADVCLQKLDVSDPVLAASLRRVIQQKQANLPGNIWRATLAGNEFRSFWRNKNEHPARDPELSEALAALNADITRWLQGDYEVDPTRFEALLEVVNSGHGGAMLNSWQHLVIELELATLIADRRLARGPLCRNEIKPKSAEIFNRVVNRYFIGGVQLKLAMMNAATYEIETSVSAIETLLASSETPAYAQWREHRVATIQAGREAVRQHVSSLEPLLRQCGFLRG